MTTESELDLRATRPTDHIVDQEFPPARREAVLNAVLDPHRVTVIRRSPGPRLLVAAGIALVLAVGGAVGVVTSQQPSQDPPAAGAQPSVAQPPAGPNTQPPPPSAQEGVTLEQVADVAGRRAAPVKLGPTQFRRSVTVEQQDGGATITHENYVSADGWTWRKTTEKGQDTYWMLYRAGDELDPANLPTDPKRLEQELMKFHLGTASDTQGLYKLIGEVILTDQAPPKVRAAAIELLADLAQRPVRTMPARKGGKTTPDIAVIRGLIEERPAVGARFTDKSVPQLRYTMWFDTKTSELIRTDQVFRGGTSFSSEVRSRTIVDTLPPEFVTKLGTKRVEKLPR